MRVRTILIALLLLAAPTTASADADSLITAGFGTALGVNQSTPLHGDPQTSFTTELSFKLKMLHVFGFEFTYAPTDALEEQSSLIFDSQFRMSALVYIVPTYPVNFYLKGGLGSTAFLDLFDYTADTASYHAGAGMDFHIDEHWVLGAEFLLLIPGVASVRNTIASYANQELANYQARARDEPVTDGPDLGVKDFISPDNFRVTVSARYYF